jgi:hypothetical protein
LQIKTEEEQSKDDEKSHVGESVGYILFDGEGTLKGVPGDCSGKLLSSFLVVLTIQIHRLQMTWTMMQLLVKLRNSNFSRKTNMDPS